LERYRVDNEQLAREQADQQELNAILMQNLMELMKNKSEYAKNVWKKNIPQK
jgi:hypothetical protein